MKTSTRVALASGAALGAVLATSAMASSSVERNALALDDLLPVLTEARVAQDALPESEAIDDLEGLHKDEARFLGESKAVKYWAAPYLDDRVCLIESLKESQGTGVSCTTIARFQQEGVGGVTGISDGTEWRKFEAYLLPSDVADAQIGLREERDNSRSTSESINLLTSGPGEPGLESDIYSRQDGSKFEFSPLTLEGE